MQLKGKVTFIFSASRLTICFVKTWGGLKHLLSCGVDPLSSIKGNHLKWMQAVGPTKPWSDGCRQSPSIKSGPPAVWPTRWPTLPTRKWMNLGPSYCLCGARVCKISSSTPPNKNFIPEEREGAMERRTYFLFFIGQRSSVADRGGLSFQGFPIIDFQFLFNFIFIFLFKFY